MLLQCNYNVIDRTIPKRQIFPNVSFHQNNNYIQDNIDGSHQTAEFGKKPFQYYQYISKTFLKIKQLYDCQLDELQK